MAIHEANETTPLCTDPTCFAELSPKGCKRWLTLTGAWLALFLSAFNTTVVATLLSTISSEFESAQNAGWLGTSYLLASCTLTPLYGRLCDILGRKRANQLAVALMTVGVVISACASSMISLVLGRFITGLGGGGIGITASIIMSDMFSARSRGLAQSLASLFSALGLGLGGPIGGYIGETFGWRPVFLIQVPLLALSMILTELNLSYRVPGRRKNANTKHTLRRIDYLGTCTLFLMILSLLVFMSNKFNEDLPWESHRVLIPLGLFLSMVIIFVLVELYLVKEPILTKELFVRREAVLISASNFLVPICNYSITYFFPIWFQTVKLDSPSAAGLHILPHSIATTTGSIVAGWIMHSTGEFKKLMIIAGILPCIGGVMLSTMHRHSNFFVLWFSIVPYGFGNACVLQTTMIALLASIPRSSLAIGTGFVQLFRGIGQVLGVAIASAVYQSKLSSELHRRIQGPNAQESIRLIRSSSTIVGSLPYQLQEIARESYALSLRYVFIVATVCTFLAWFTRCFIRAQSLDDDVDGDLKSHSKGSVISEESDSSTEEDTSSTSTYFSGGSTRRSDTAH